MAKSPFRERLNRRMIHTARSAGSGRSPLATVSSGSRAAASASVKCCVASSRHLVQRIVELLDPIADLIRRWRRFPTILLLRIEMARESLIRQRPAISLVGKDSSSA